MERTEREGERVDRLRTERRPDVWHCGGLESEGVGGGGVWVETFTEGGRSVFFGLVKEPKESCTGTETCVAPRHACRCATWYYALLTIGYFCFLCGTRPVLYFILFSPYYQYYTILLNYYTIVLL